jgi:hypothetical protein
MEMESMYIVAGREDEEISEHLPRLRLELSPA